MGLFQCDAKRIFRFVSSLSQRFAHIIGSVAFSESESRRVGYFLNNFFRLAHSFTEKSLISRFYQTEYMPQSSEWAKRPAIANSNEFFPTSG
jgi:hypothetical protein